MVYFAQPFFSTRLKLSEEGEWLQKRYSKGCITFSLINQLQLAEVFAKIVATQAVASAVKCQEWMTEDCKI
jgi:phosphoenolpyruvate carboxylase